MGYDGAGGYTRERNFSADASAGIRILASAVDQELNDFASAMGLALLRDGQAAATNDIPMGGNRLTNVGGPTSASNYTRAADVISNIPIYMIDAETSTDRISVSAAYFTTASAGASPAGGTGILVKMGSDKGSAPALYLNTGDGNPHSANVVMNDASALYSGAIRSGGIYEFIFASAASTWHLMNPTFRIATTDTPGLVEAATTAEAAAGTDTTRYITPATLSDKFSADAATTASAGLIELATTAEVVAGTDTSRAVTPAALDVVVSTLSSDAALGAIAYSAVPYLGVFVTNSAGGSASFSALSLNYKASAFSISSVNANTRRINFGTDLLASTNGAVVDIWARHATESIRVRNIAVDVSGTNFVAVSSDGGNFSSSANLFFQMNRIF